MKIVLLTILALNFVSNAALAQKPMLHPQSAQQVARSLETQVLNEEQIGDLFDTRRSTQQPVSDLEFFAALRIAPAPSNEGIPSTANPVIPPVDIINNAYSAAELIAVALQEKNSLPMGEKISFLREQAPYIIQVSGQMPTEILLRVALNRGVDVVNHALPIAGQNSAHLARMLANFLRENYELAASMGNNKIGVTSRLTGTEEPNVAEFLRKVSIAEFGRIYASLLWSYTQELTSESAKAVMLMRLVGYLGWDLNSDLRRRETPIAQTIADIYRLQHGQLYRKILNTLAANQEPNSQDVASFRRQIFTILQRLPGRLQEAGIARLN